MWGVPRSSHLQLSLSAECSSFSMDRTLAVSPRLLPLPPTSFVKFNGRISSCSSRSSLSIGGSASCLRAIKCSAATSPYYAEQEAKFHEASKQGNLVPVYSCILSDHLTPVMAYRCLVKEDERDAPSFLFESVEPGLHASTIGRYSVIGAQPSVEIVAKENMVTIMDHYEGQRTEEIVEDPMDVPRRMMESWVPQLVDELPDVFNGGWVGYFSYDTVRYVEKKKLPFSFAPPDDRNLPDVHLGLYEDVMVFDHLEKKAYLIHWVRLDRFSTVGEAFEDGITRLQNLYSRLHNVPKINPVVN